MFLGLFGHSRANIRHWCSCIEELIVFNPGGFYLSLDKFDKARIFIRCLKSYFRTQADASSRLNERARDVVGFLPRNCGTSDKLVFLCFAGQLEERLTTRS